MVRRKVRMSLQRGAGRASTAPLLPDERLRGGSVFARIAERWWQPARPAFRALRSWPRSWTFVDLALLDAA